jgi:hypothetical protein
MADGKRYRSVVSLRTAVTETILHETAERHGVAAMGILSFGAPWRMSFARAIGAVHGDWRWPAAFDSDSEHEV